VLTLGEVNPPEGHTGTSFQFDVMFTDADDEYGSVNLILDGKTYTMTADPTDYDATDGVAYTFKTKLKEGDHTYYFEGTDDYGYDATGPCVGDDNRRSFTVYNEQQAVPGAEALMALATIGIIGAALVLQRRKELKVTVKDEELEEVMK
ncbi:MAG: hypothetical protein KAS77_10785, partial [Thermoplasmata archaeon]|nr:hypothetical protein [Thermoplasmata archaeon]